MSSLYKRLRHAFRHHFNSHLNLIQIDSSSMAANSRQTGEASRAKFETIYCNEFFNNGRESYRVCITEVNGKPKVNLNKFYFQYNEQQWLPTKQNLYFNVDAWTTFVAKAGSLDKELRELGLSGLSTFLLFFHYLSNAEVDLYIRLVIFNYLLLHLI